MKERNKWLIREIQNDREFLFPRERLGLGDKLILNLVVDEIAEHFRSYHPQGKVHFSAVLGEDINKKMGEFGI